MHFLGRALLIQSLAILSRAFAGGESGRHKGLYSKVLRFADALPRLALPLQRYAQHFLCST